MRARIVREQCADVQVSLQLACPLRALESPCQPDLAHASTLPSSALHSEAKYAAALQVRV